ncbi:hypothetical protein Csa_006404, partial [Cucumis sativus]
MYGGYEHMNFVDGVYNNQTPCPQSKNFRPPEPPQPAAASFPNKERNMGKVQLPVEIEL